jgi:metal-sulfur cluster biosynthetic enzyme
VQADELDQRADLGLSIAQQDRAAAYPQAACQHRQVEHQRCVREHELAEVDDDVRLGGDRAHERAAPTCLRRPVLVTAATQDRGFVCKLDDARKPTESWGPVTRGRHDSRTLSVTMTTVDEVTDALRDVIDPELGLDFVELGLIYDVEVDEDGTVRVTYTLTSPGCPIGPQVSEQIAEFVGELDGVSDVQPTMTFSPPWTPERMSEDAKFALGF